MYSYSGTVPNESGTEATRKQILFSPRKKTGKRKQKSRQTKKIKKELNLEMLEQEELMKEKDRLLKEELAKLDPKKAPTAQDSSFYPAPPNLQKRRCYFHKGARALKCTVCSGGNLKNSSIPLPILIPTSITQLGT